MFEAIEREIKEEIGEVKSPNDRQQMRDLYKENESLKSQLAAKDLEIAQQAKVESTLMKDNQELKVKLAEFVACHKATGLAQKELYKLAAKHGE